MNMRQYPSLRFVVGDGSAAKGLDVGQMDGGPNRGIRVFEFSAGADDLHLRESGDEGGYDPLANLVRAAELIEGSEEILAVVERHHEGAADDDFLATHEPSLPMRVRAARPMATRRG